MENLNIKSSLKLQKRCASADVRGSKAAPSGHAGGTGVQHLGLGTAVTCSVPVALPTDVCWLRLHLTVAPHVCDACDAICLKLSGHLVFFS